VQEDTFTANAGFAVAYDSAPGGPSTPVDLSNVGGLQASGNGHDAISIGSVTAGGTWPDTGLSLYLSGNVTVSAGASITLTTGTGTPAPVLPYIGGALTVNTGGQATILPGTTVRFDTGGYVTANGTLDAEGSPTHSITLTSAQPSPAPGDWNGLVFNSGGGGTLNDVTIAYAGRSYHNEQAAVYVQGANPTISNSTIADSAGNGLEVNCNNASPCLPTPTLEDDVFTDNASFAVVYDNAPADLSNVGGLQASGNGQDAILVGSVGSGTITGTWPATGLSLSLAAGASVSVQGGGQHDADHGVGY
jgi:hypothetical protein